MQIVTLLSSIALPTLIIMWNYRRFLPYHQEVKWIGCSMPIAFEVSAWKIEMMQTMTSSIFVSG